MRSLSSSYLHTHTPTFFVASHGTPRAFFGPMKPSLVPSTSPHLGQFHQEQNLNSLKRTATMATTRSPSTSSSPQYFYRDAEQWPTAQDITLRQHDLQNEVYVDLIVAGAGPSGVAVAQRVAAAGFSVCVVDPDPFAHWPNNYGVWVDEFQSMGLEDCLHVVWPKAKIWLDSEKLGAKFLKRAFGRVDRPKLKRKLLEKCATHGVGFLNGKVQGVTHEGGASTVKLSDGRLVTGSLVLDATGHARRLVEYDKEFDPGYQGAYGIIAEVESHPFELDTMLFMDWRDDHTKPQSSMFQSNEKLPTFLYAMPFSKTRVFLEETSLVARPAIPFPELKERLDARLRWLGIKVTKIEEEEYCLIPMGGVLPKHPQRVLGLGGTAGMVHPSTGFMMSRMMGMAPTVADAIIDQLSRPADKASRSNVARRPASEEEANQMAAAIWQATWPIERIQQRSFFTFGMDVLLSLNVYQTREFFEAFFTLSDFNWHGFLSTRLTLPQLIGFGLALFANASNSAKGNLLVQGAPGLIKMLIELAPTVSPSYYPASKSVKDIKDEEDRRAEALRAMGQLRGRDPVPMTARRF